MTLVGISSDVPIGYLDLSFVIICHNHEKYIEECILSVIETLPEPAKLIIVDSGSSDSTISQAMKVLSSRGREAIFLSTGNNPNTSVSALKVSLPHVSTKWFGILSGDDALLPEYGKNALNALNAWGDSVVLNFVQSMCDEKGNFLRKSKPRWTRWAKINKLLLILENPGKAPGAIIPIDLLRKSEFTSFSDEVLIEDYLLWTALVDTAKIRTVRTGGVLYRQHESSLSNARNSLAFAESIGYCMGLAERSAQTLLQKKLYRIGAHRWLRQVDRSLHPEVIAAQSKGSRL